MFEPSQQQQQQQLQSPPMPPFLSPPRSSSQPPQTAVEQAAQQLGTSKSNTSTTCASGNLQSTTDPLGRGEETSNFSPKHGEAQPEVAEPGGVPNPSPSSSQSVIPESEWQMTEDPKEYVAPTKGSNLTYNMWSLGNLKLLVRCSYHGNQRHLRKPVSRIKRGFCRHY